MVIITTLNLPAMIIRLKHDLYCSRECATERGVDVVLMNERPEMGLCSRGWAIERSLDGMVVNKRAVENMLFT